MENDRKKKGAEEITGSAVSQRGAKAFAVTFRALSKAGITILCLLQPSVECGAYNGDRLKGIAREQMKFLPWRKRADNTHGERGSLHRLDLRLSCDKQHYSAERPSVVFHRNQRSGVDTWVLVLLSL